MEEEPSCSTSTKHNEWELGRTTVSPMDMNTDESQSQPELEGVRVGGFDPFSEENLDMFSLPEVKPSSGVLAEEGLAVTTAEIKLEDSQEDQNVSKMGGLRIHENEETASAAASISSSSCVPPCGSGKQVAMKAESKDEDEAKKGATKPPILQIIFHPDDERVYTDDPEQIKKLLRFPAGMFLRMFDTKNPEKEINPFGPDDKFVTVVSKEFLLENTTMPEWYIDKQKAKQDKDPVLSGPLPLIRPQDAIPIHTSPELEKRWEENGKAKAREVLKEDKRRRRKAEKEKEKAKEQEKCGKKKPKKGRGN